MRSLSAKDLRTHPYAREAQERLPGKKDFVLCGIHPRKIHLLRPCSRERSARLGIMKIVSVRANSEKLEVNVVENAGAQERT